MGLLDTIKKMFGMGGDEMEKDIPEETQAPVSTEEGTEEEGMKEESPMEGTKETEGTDEEMQ